MIKEGFKSIEDIILEVAEEEGMTFKEINDLWKHQKIYVKKKMDQKNVFAIFLPFLGTLSLNVKQYYNELRGRDKHVYKDFVTKVKDLENNENFKYASSHNKIAGPSKLVQYIIKNFDIEIKRKKVIVPHNLCWDLISKYSNNKLKQRVND